MSRKRSPFPRKLAPKPVVLVRWLDAYTVDETFDDKDRTHNLAPTVTVGFLVRDDRTGVTVTTDVQLPDPNDKDGESAYRGKHHIPRGMIQDVTVIRK